MGDCKHLLLHSGGSIWPYIQCELCGKMLVRGDELLVPRSEYPLPWVDAHNQYGKGRGDE